MADLFGALEKEDFEIAYFIRKEHKRQEENLELIASENYVSDAVRGAQGSVCTNKYAEGYPSKRYYGGCEYIDEIEDLAIERAKKLFGAEHVNVQPHSGSQANMAVYYALLKPGDTILGLGLDHGGHLTHGSKVSISGTYFHAVNYGLDEHEMMDYPGILSLAKEHHPKLIVAGASAYSRIIDFKKLREIADEVGAYLMVDMAHIAGLVAADLHPSPVPYADVVTSTTHKTLRGPRGGLILCRASLAKAIDKAVFPGIQGGPLEHVIAAKAVAFEEALKPEFKNYQRQILNNCKTLSGELESMGYRIVSEGTDNHLFLVDLRNKGITGKEAQAVLDRCSITVNKNAIPNDPEKPGVTSGIRIGVAAVTTRGMEEPQMVQIAHIIDKALTCGKDPQIMEAARKEVLALTAGYPLFSEKWRS